MSKTIIFALLFRKGLVVQCPPGGLTHSFGRDRIEVLFFGLVVQWIE